MPTPKTKSRPAVDGGDDASEQPARRVRAVLLRLLVVAVAVLATVGTVEVAFRVCGYRSLAELYKGGPDAFWMADEVLGWSYQPGTTGEFVGPYPFPISFRSTFRINSLGLRGPEVTELPPGGLRVLVLGDSVTSGLEVAENETYSAVAAQRLSERLAVPVQVINAGVRGYGTDQEWLFYRERLRRLHPDVVVHHTVDNDPADNIMLHGLHAWGKPAFVLGADNALHLIGQPVPNYPRCAQYWAIDGAARRVDDAWSRSMCWLRMNLVSHSAAFSAVAQHMWTRNPSLVRTLWEPGSPQLEYRQYALRLTSTLIGRMAEDVRRDGAHFVLMGKDVDLQQLDVSSFERAGIPLFRIGSAFGPDTQIPYDSAHPNALGHSRIGELLAGQIEPLLREVLQAKAPR